MKHLCDSNVFFALMLARHPHYQAAKTWIEALRESEQACFCRVTQQAFLRLLTVEAILGDDVRTNREALAALRELRRDPRIDFIHREPNGLEALWLKLASHPSSAPKRWMDAYLAAFAICLGARFVTFDRGFRQFVTEGLDLILLT